jgi:hypothetical protein
MRFQCGKFGATIFINTNTHLVWSQIYISAPSSCHNTELQDFKRFFLSLVSLVYVDKLAVFKIIGKVLISNHDQALLLGAIQKHVLFPCPSVRLNLQTPHILTGAKHIYKICGGPFLIGKRFLYL